MVDYATFAVGGVVLPLPSSTQQDFIRVADPALYYVANFLSSVLETYLGDAMRTRFGAEGLNIPGAVAGPPIYLEPTPFLTHDNLRFPLLAVYRKSETHDEHTASWEKAMGEWEFAYVLPHLTHVQELRLAPVLTAVRAVIKRAVSMGADPAYLSGASAWAVAGIQRAWLSRVAWGSYEFIDQVKTYRAIIGSLSIWERDMPVADAFEAFEGADVDVSLAYPDETSVANVSQIKTYQSPTVTNCVGNTGSKAGGTSVTITGTNFRKVTSVTFGGVAATDVVVNSTTSITCTTPAHEAYPTALVSIEVTNDDGLSGSLAAAFTFTTP